MCSLIESDLTETEAGSKSSASIKFGIHSAVILTGAGSGMYKRDPAQARDTKCTGDLCLTPLYLLAMFGEVWIYWVQVTPPPKMVPPGKGFLEK